MNAAAKVSNYLSISEHLLEVREWAFVYWVRVAGQRPTMLSKKMVDRYQELELMDVIGDSLVRDNRTGHFYSLRSAGYYCGQQWSIRHIAKGTRINSEYPVDFSCLPGDIYRESPSRRPQNLRQLLIRRAAA